MANKQPLIDMSHTAVRTFFAQLCTDKICTTTCIINRALNPEDIIFRSEKREEPAGDHAWVDTIQEQSEIPTCKQVPTPPQIQRLPHP